MAQDTNVEDEKKVDGAEDGASLTPNTTAPTPDSASESKTDGDEA